MCPSGVEYEAIAELITRSEKVHWDDLDQTDEFRYIDLSTVDRVTHSINGTETITRENAPSRAQQVVREGDVLFGTTRPMLKRYCIVPADYDGQVASTGFCVLRANTDRILTNFLFHLLGTATFYEYVQTNERGASYPAIPDNVVKKFRIPVPPLEVQREIVRVLDKFTQLEAELEAELEARRAQYEHYRHEVLSSSNGAALTSVGEIVHGVSSGRNKSRSEGGAYPVYGSTGQIGTTNAPAYSGLALLIARVGANAGRVNIVDGEYDVSDNTLVVTPAEAWDVYYAYHQLTNMRLNQYAVGGGQPLVTGKLIKALKVALPDVDEQRRIAGVLDKFDALVNDISIGLPAELAARRKQYDHYRDRLLTFKEAA
nr:restriction endonuclease subunit S [Brevibacterium luteolum]